MITHIILIACILPAWFTSFEERKIGWNAFYTFGISINITMIVLYLSNRIN